jgi:plastocyanin
MTSRRDIVKAAGLALGGFVIAPLVVTRPRHSGLEVIQMRSDAPGAQVWFDPIGLYVDPGTTVRWIVRESVHTTAAYHPRNDKHSLRIPAAAAPWDSGYLVHPRDHFEVTLTVPGVYDYFCAPHEGAGMVGRIVVGNASGPGAEPFDYWVGRAGTDDWREVPDAARAAFPGVARILREHHVHPEVPES